MAKKSFKVGFNTFIDGILKSKDPTQPVADTNDIKGAPKNVNDIAGRNAISMDLREKGMVCNVHTNPIVRYQLQEGIANENWVDITAGQGAISLKTITAITLESGTLNIIDTLQDSNKPKALLSIQDSSNNEYIGSYLVDSYELDTTWKIKIYNGGQEKTGLTLYYL